MKRVKLPICNSKVVSEAVTATGESQKMVELVVDFASNFVVGRMREGSLESVRFPRFGLFRAKLEAVQYRAEKKARPKYTQRIAGGPLTGTGIEDQTETE